MHLYASPCMSHFMMAYVGIDVNWEMMIHLSSVSSISFTQMIFPKVKPMLCKCKSWKAVTAVWAWNQTWHGMPKQGLQNLSIDLNVNHVGWWLVSLSCLWSRGFSKTFVLSLFCKQMLLSLFPIEMALFSKEHVYPCLLFLIVKRSWKSSTIIYER